ncbi:hypothetical protein ACO2Q1_10205 [Brevundimonas sp. VNH65]|uniref:hypothetical protein n=1 Tax=Brevundimonas sp. VNH65 TaxID=3400917 RepID=UPI003C033234
MHTTTDPHEHLTTLAAALIRDGRSDWRAGIGSLLREVEAREPGFIQKLAAIDQMRRLGLPVTEVWR